MIYPKLEIFETDLIKDVIDLMRPDKPISGISEANGISTITTDSLILVPGIEMSLTAGLYVEIGTKFYKVLSINSALQTFDIEATGIVEDTWRLAINFMFGSRIEINEMLANYAKDNEMNTRRFPLIWLFINYKEDHNQEQDIEVQAPLTFAFVGLSKPEWRANDRLENVMRPLLSPLWLLFLNVIKEMNDTFYFDTSKEPVFSRYKRFFYGSSDKNESVLASITDAYEITLQLNIINKF
jgi:hypothetical protein